MKPQNAPISVSTPTCPVTAETAKRTQQPTYDKPQNEYYNSWIPLTKGPFLWVLVIMFAVLYFGRPIKRILYAVAKRIERGDTFGFWKFSMKPSSIPVKLEDEW